MADTENQPTAGSSAQRERADLPAPRTVEQPWMSLAEWHRRFEVQLRDPDRSRARLVMLGDSITEAWCPSQPFQARFGAYHPLNLGIGGDQTQHVLWRIDQGALTGLDPQLLVLMIGVNNLGNGFTPAETVTGVRAVLGAVRRHLRDTPILVLSILPSGHLPGDPMRDRIRAANEGIAELAEPGRVDVKDVGRAFLEPDGSIAATVMGDFLHPTLLGQQRLTDAAAPLIERYLTPGSRPASEAAPPAEADAP